jgi:hypothetical protein
VTLNRQNPEAVRRLGGESEQGGLADARLAAKHKHRGSFLAGIGNHAPKLITLLGAANQHDARLIRISTPDPSADVLMFYMVKMIFVEVAAHAKPLPAPGNIACSGRRVLLLQLARPKRS